MADKNIKGYYPGWFHNEHQGFITLKFEDDSQIELRNLSYEDFTSMVDILRNSSKGSVWYSDDRGLLGTQRQLVGVG
ncbi:hypothetical protein H6G80_29925 [Nostoc sp. FACHB-87]|uniref:hypothetical protein n=1 Tax=Nostocaceae TaxID=1162 RepID=UPI001688AEDD|nr:MULTISPECIES: hypothetical protein [Nostocaceae]MBD2458272.1 hypothetical protein [Nostoc sp. FACHB-87]MBD2480057.1 hypothetical protein [Anabaena sp. FACHB-83]